MPFTPPHGRRNLLVTTRPVTVMAPGLALTFYISYFDTDRSFFSLVFQLNPFQIVLPSDQLLGWYSILTGVGMPISSPPWAIRL